MSEGKKDIESIFRESFAKHEMASPANEWIAMSSKLTKMNFLKLSLSSFNIYYAAVGLLILTTGATIGISKAFSDPDTDNALPVNEITIEESTSTSNPADDPTTNSTAFDSSTSGSVQNNEASDDGNIDESSTENNFTGETKTVNTGNSATQKSKQDDKQAKNAQDNMQQNTGTNVNSSQPVEKTKIGSTGNPADTGIKNAQTTSPGDTSQKRHVVEKVYKVQRDTIEVFDTIMKTVKRQGKKGKNKKRN